MFPDPALRDQLTPVLDGLAHGEDPPGAEVVKQSRVRRVLRIALADGTPVYVKRYESRGWGARLRALVTRSRAERELRNLLRTRALGIPAVEPLACAVRGRGVARGEALLVTRAAPHAEPLERALARGSGPAGQGAGATLLAELARHARRLHDHGLWHRDLHAGNVLAQTPPGGETSLPILLDLQKMRPLGMSVPRRLRARDLALLLSELPGAGPEVAEGLIRAYAEAGPPAPIEALASEVGRAVARRRERRLRSRARRCVVPSTGFRVERTATGRLYRRADIEGAAVLGAIARHRVRFSDADPPPPAGRRTRIERVVGGPPPGRAPSLFGRGQGAKEPGAPACASVEVLDLPGRRGLAVPWRWHAGMAAWRTAHALLVRGVETPTPLALVEVRALAGVGPVCRSYLVRRLEDGSENLASFLTREPSASGATRLAPAARRDLARAVGELVGRLAAAGFVPAGLGPDDLLVRTASRHQAPAAREILVARPQGVRLLRTLPGKPCAALARWTGDPRWRGLGIPRISALRALRAAAQAAGAPAASWRDLARNHAGRHGWTPPGASPMDLSRRGGRAVEGGGLENR